MGAATLAELRELLQDEEVRGALASARAHPERPSARRLLWLVAVADAVLASADGPGAGGRE